MAAQEIITTDLIINPVYPANYYYRGDDVNDSGGYGNTLTNNNSVTFTSGKFGNAFNFGSTAGNNLSVSSATRLGVSGNYSISMWINVTTAPATNSHNQIFATGNSGQNGVGIFYSDVSGVKKIRIDSSGTTSYYDVTLTIGTWYHIVLKGNANSFNNSTLWVNNSNVMTIAANNSAYDPGAMYIGNGFAGLVDDICMFGGEIADATVGLIYNGGLTAAPTGLVALSKATGGVNWTVPAGVSKIKIVGIGGGGKGGNRTATVGGTGGGGAGARAVTTMNVTPGDVFALVAGGANGGADATAIRSSVTYMSADSGLNGSDNSTTPGTGGLASNCTGDSKYDGGDGYTGTTGPGVGGGGGAAALDATNGTDATSQSGASGGSTYAGGGGSGGGLNSGGGGGASYGGAGGGCQRNSGGGRNGGGGQNGIVWITNVPFVPKKGSALLGLF